MGELEDGDKELYEEVDGAYKILAESAGALRRAKEHESLAAKKAKAELKIAKERIKEIEAKAEEKQNEETEQFKNTGDFKEYETRLKAKHLQEIADRDAAIADRDSKILGKHRYDRAHAIATEISTVPDLLADKIANHIGASYDSEGGVDLYVHDENGKRSVETFEGLTSKFRLDTKYKGIIIDTRATGGAGHATRPMNSGGFPKTVSGTDDSKVDYTTCGASSLADAIDIKFGN